MRTAGAAPVPVVLALVFAVFVGPGCDRDGGAGSAGTMDISVILQAVNSDYWKLVEAGAREAGKNLGVRVTVLGPSDETKIMEHMCMVEDQIVKRVSALCIAATQPDSIKPALEGAKEKGIPVVFLDTDVDWPDKVTFVGTGNYAGGRIAGEYLARILPQGSKAAILRGALGDPVHDDRANGCIDALEEAGIAISTIQPANSSRDMGMTVMENILESKIPFDGVFATNDEMALGAVKAIEAARKTIPVVGFDGAPDALESIKEGKLNATASQEAYRIGYLAVQSAVDAVLRRHVDKRINTGVKIINKANVDRQIAEITKQLKKK